MLHRYSRLWLAVLILVIFLAAFLGGCEPDTKAPKPSVPKPMAAAPDEAETARFLERQRIALYCFFQAPDLAMIGLFRI